jgi:hypothetical protein
VRRYQRRKMISKPQRSTKTGIILVKFFIFFVPLCGYLILFAPAANTHMSSQENRPDYKNSNLPVDRRVADLLSRMTLEEKMRSWYVFGNGGLKSNLNQRQIS